MKNKITNDDSTAESVDAAVNSGTTHRADKLQSSALNELR